MDQTQASGRYARLMQWSLTIAIVIVLNLLFNVGLQLFSKAPTYDVFCPQPQVQREIVTEEACLAVGGQWNEYGEVPMKGGIVPAPVMEGQRSYCYAQFTCSKNFEEALKVYNRNTFLFLVVAGAVAFLIGFFLSSSVAVSLGFTWGGVLSFVIGSARYWADMNEYLRFVILLIVLCVLVWLGVKKLRDAHF